MTDDLEERIRRISASDTARNARMHAEVRDQFNLLGKLLLKLPREERERVFHLLLNELNELVGNFRAVTASLILDHEPRPKQATDDEQLKAQVFARLDKQFAYATKDEDEWK